MCNKAIDGETVAYGYDPVGRLKQLTIGDHTALQISRDELGHEIERYSSAGFKLQQKFGALGLLVEQRVGASAKSLADMAQSKSTTQAIVDRHYQWNKSLEPTAIRDKRWGETRYEYDRNGQITRSRFGSDEERFSYDPRLNIEATAFKNPAAQQAQQIADKLTKWQGGSDGRVETAQSPQGEQITLTYDAKGRVVEKCVAQNGFRPKIWRFEWNGLDRLIAAHTPEGTKWTYGYDAFARRLWKQEWISAIEQDGNIRYIAWHKATRHDFLWDGDVIASEAITCGEDEAQRVDWYFEPDTFVPIARCEQGYLSYVITDHLGTPREVVSETGALEWAAQYRTWGAILRETGGHPRSGLRPVYDKDEYGFIPLDATNTAPARQPTPPPHHCPIRFQGQWEDNETGLFYNRHRYYDTQSGSYICSDPAGILGGLRQTGYAQNPNTIIDPLGLQHKNSNSAVGNWSIYQISVDGELFKVGVADARRITQSSGLPTRLHNQLRILRECYGADRVTFTRQELRNVTKKCAKVTKNAQITTATLANGGHVPPGNSRSFRNGIATAAENCSNGKPLSARRARVVGAKL